MTKLVKGVELEFASVPIGAVTGMERDMVRKVVQQPASRQLLYHSATLASTLQGVSLCHYP